MRVVSAVNMGSYSKSRIAGTVCVRVNSHMVCKYVISKQCTSCRLCGPLPFPPEAQLASASGSSAFPFETSDCSSASVIVVVNMSKDYSRETSPILVEKYRISFKIF